MDATLTTYLTAIHGFDAVVQRADPARWDHQSPCELWNARGVVNHVLFMSEMVKGMAVGKPAIVEGNHGYPAPGVPGWSVRHELVQIAVSPVIRPSDDPKPVWSARRDELIDAVTASDAIHAPSMSPWGHPTTEGFLPVAGGDVVVHTWDLAVALGQEPDIDPALAEAALDAWAQLEKAGCPVRQPFVLGRAETTDSADALTRLLSHTGRRTG